MRSLPRVASVLLLLVSLFACELTEVTVAEGEPHIIVQSVLSANEFNQFAVVERSLTGLDDAPVFMPGGVTFPIAGALVTLTNDGPSACASTVDTLFGPSNGRYEANVPCRPSAGDRVRLRVVTPEGEVVTGTTTVPGARWVSVRLSTDSAAFPGQGLELDRQRDTIRIGVDAILARAMQVEVRGTRNLDDVAVYLFTDTLGVALPGDLINPFEGDSGRPVFEVGEVYALTVAVTDTNYYDFVRSRSDPFTGRGFLNHLEGGIGVFGSVEAYTYYLRVVR
jgi:hypothetical protein